MTTSQSDIAKYLGIGQKTVSRVFTTPEQVTDELRTQVLMAARKMGYRPNSGTRSLRTGKSSSVVVVGSTLTEVSPLPERLMLGLEDVLTAADVSLSMTRLSEDHQLHRFVPKMVRELVTDGLFINYQTSIPQLLIDLITEQQLPVVWLNSKQATASVRPDDRKAGDDATRCLIEHGHKRILYADFFIEQSQWIHYSRKDRLAGYRAAMTRAGLSHHEAIPDHAVEAGPYSAAMIDRHTPTAIVAYGHVELTAFMMSAFRKGLELPRDLSLVSFSENPIFVGQPIATWLVPQLEVGRTAARLLLASINQGGSPISATTIPFTHELGNSLARPAAL